jgi:predicted dehydrogenase
MHKNVNWGVLGASNFARNLMGPAIHAAKGARLAALATSSLEKAKGFQAFAPDLSVNLDYETMLADPAVDAVYIPLPNSMHVEWSLKALAAGKHVLTEKPIALRAPEIDQLIAARDASGLHLAEAYMIVHHPQWQRVRDWLSAGEIGTLRHVDTAFSFDNRADTANIRNRPETGGGGIRDIGVYAYGSILWATGAEPTELSARLKRENGIDTWAQVVGQMAAARVEPFTFSAMTSMRLPKRQEVVFQGDRGLIRLTAPFNANVFAEAQVHLHRVGMPELTERFPGVDQYVHQVEAFGRTVREGAPYAWTLEQARGTQEMIDRVFAEAAEI